MTDLPSTPPSIADAGTSGAAPAPVAAASAPRSTAWVWRLVGALVVLLIAAASLFVAWRADQRVLHLEQELVKRQQDSAGQSTEARMLAKQADEGARDTAAKVALLEAKVAEVSVQRGQLEDLIQSLSRSRDENLLVDVEAAVRVALRQSAITGSAEPLVATLKQSDERLARYDQPRLEGVRRAITRDLERAKGTSVADVSSLSIKLDEAVRLVDELPLLAVGEPRRDGGAGAKAVVAPVVAGRASTAAGIASAPASAVARVGAFAASEPASAASSSGWGSRWTSSAFGEAWSGATGRIWNEVKSLVRVTRIDRPEAMLIAPEQAFFLKENLKLRLLNARLALLSRQFDTAQADSQVAQLAIDRYFDRNSKRTVVVSDLLKQVALQSRQVSLPRPDDTLAALAAASAGR